MLMYKRSSLLFSYVDTGIIFGPFNIPLWDHHWITAKSHFHLGNSCPHSTSYQNSNYNNTIGYFSFRFTSKVFECHGALIQRWNTCAIHARLNASYKKIRVVYRPLFTFNFPPNSSLYTQQFLKNIIYFLIRYVHW